MPYRGELGKCERCGIEGQKNLINGMCLKCYKRVWYEDTTSAKKREKHRDKTRFSGVRKKVLKRDGYACVDCGTTEERLGLHHLDGKGYRDGDQKRNEEVNNDPSNLVTLCQACHIKRHGKENMWSKKYSLSECKVCGSSEYRHTADGLCSRCYDKSRGQKRYARRRLVYDSCVVCGTTERKIHGHGMCKRCYQRDSRSKNKQ